MRQQIRYGKPLAGLSSIVLLGCMILQVGAPSIARETTSTRLVAEAYDKLPASFEPNLGQADPKVKFLCRGSGNGVFLTSAEVVLWFGKPAAGSALRMKLVHANPNPEIEGLDPLPGTTNYLIGKDFANWHAGVPSYAQVKYRQVYPGIDVIYYGTQGQLEYDVVLSPGADPSAVRLAFEGSQAMRVDSYGNLVLSTAAGEVVQRRPVVWQEQSGVTKQIAARYAIRGANEAGFEIDNYDLSATLVIDPVLVWSTYLAGNSVEGVQAVAADSAGNVYVAGSTSSPDFPTTAGSLRPRWDVVPQCGFGGCSFPSISFVTKFDSQGRLVYSTLLGGQKGGADGGDRATALAVDSAGNAYITGRTVSSDFPTTPRAFQTTFPAPYAAFVAKLNAAGTGLVFSTFLGRGYAGGIAVDGAGNSYIAGVASSPDFPMTPGAFQTTFPAPYAAFITKLNTSGSALVYSSYLGVVSDDPPHGAVAVDAEGCAYVAGTTRSTSFPTTPGAFQTAYRSQPQRSGNAFVTKLNPDGTALAYSTYLGGSFDHRAAAIVVDSAGSAYVAGDTNSRDFPTTPGALQTTFPGQTGASHAFVTKFNPSGSGLVYSTYLGGNAGVNPLFGAGYEEVRSMTVDGGGNVYIMGISASTDFPVTPDAFQPTLRGSPNVFLTKLNAVGTSLVYSTYFGGRGHDQALGIALDPAGYVYVGGNTDSADFPTTGDAFQSSAPASGTHGFVAKLSLPAAPPIPAFEAAGVVNAASFLGGRVAPGEIITIFGFGLGPTDLTTLQLDTAGMVATTLSGARVLFDGAPAPMVYALRNQLSAIVPYTEAQKSSIQVQVENVGTRSPPVTLPVAPSSPGVFTVNSSGKGQGAILNQDSSVNSAGNPASVGSIVSIYATGEGQTNPPGVDGSLAGSVLPKPLAPVGVKIGGITAEVQYAGAAPGLVAGVLQVNAKVPAGVTPGSAVPVSLTVGTATSQDGATVSIRP